MGRPLLLFAAWYGILIAFRRTVLAADLRLLTAIQAWRAGGLGFLALSAHGILPGQFAWPAGLGDIAIGVTAPWVALALIRSAGFAKSQLFVVWNLLGIWIWPWRSGWCAMSAGFVPGTCRKRHDGTDGTAPARRDSRLPRAPVHHVSCHRAASGTAHTTRR